MRFLLASSLCAQVAFGAYYFEFYNDDQCKVGGGTHVSSGNSNCFQESGRKSFQIVGGTADFYNPVLVAYSDANCKTELGCNSPCSSASCSDGCINISDEAFQWAETAQSFKFVSGKTGCPNGCAGQCPGGHLPSKREVNTTIGEPENVEKRGGPVDAKPALTPRVKDNDYAFCTDENCQDCGTSIEINGGGCSVEGDRRSIANRVDHDFELGGYRNADQSCGGQIVANVTVSGSCVKITPGSEGGPTSYQLTAVA